MTAEQLIAAITLFRAENEDLIRYAGNRYYYNNSVPENPPIPYASQAEVLAVIPLENRIQYMTVNIAGVEYWFLPDLLTLVPKVGFLTLADKSVTMAKLQDMPQWTLIYRRSAGTGSPEISTLAQLKADLGIVDSQDLAELLDGKVDKEFGKSLIEDVLKSYIHAPHSDDQDLSGYVLKQEGYSLISDAELARLAQLKQNVYTITLPNYPTVAARCSNAVAGTDYLTGWVLEEDTNPNDISITHNLGRRIADVKVLSVDNGEETFRRGNLAYSGFVGKTQNRLVIKNLTDVAYPLVIHLIFS